MLFRSRCYGSLIHLAALFSSKASKRYQGGKTSLNLLKSKIDSQEKYIWCHAASLGEFEQGRPIIEALREKHPNKKILLTFFSPSGYEVRKDYPMVDVVSYLPLDTPSNVSKFLDIVNPEMAIFIKYEFWANYLKALHQRQVPTYIVSAIFRPTQPFFKWYGGFFLNILKNYNKLFVQDQASADLLKAHQINNVEVTGDTRFDRVSDIAKQAKSLPIAQAFAKDATVVVAGSTWQRDEEYLVRFVNANKEHKMILVPHEVNSEHIMNICAKMRCSYVLYTQTTPEEAAKANCLIVDTIGILSSLYQYGQVAYIGGGFGSGIHNILEAAVWSMPVVFGPNYKKFKEAKDLIAISGAYSINTYRQLEDLINRLFRDNESGAIAGAYVKEHTGATQIIVDELFG